MTDEYREPAGYRVGEEFVCLNHLDDLYPTARMIAKVEYHIDPDGETCPYCNGSEVTLGQELGTVASAHDPIVAYRTFNGQYLCLKHPSAPDIEVQMPLSRMPSEMIKLHCYACDAVIPTPATTSKPQSVEEALVGLSNLGRGQTVPGPLTAVGVDQNRLAALDKALEIMRLNLPVGYTTEDLIEDAGKIEAWLTR